ncbi:MerR family transcriptional regulator [Solicola sp. PLA-1-18]|uniref:MerR family transcriptional regulator n=1 Tax=Solicola sp. PLA-1-18 TaxID=3380532 RepID=UPI003B7888D3
MPEQARTRPPLLGIGAVSVLLSVPPTTLRTWGRRYGLSPTGRTAGGHRRFSDEDVLRLRLMAHLLHQGVGAGSAASAARDTAPDALATRSWLGDEPPEPVALGPVDPAQVITALVSAARELDQQAVGVLAGLSIDRTGIALAWDEVLAPFLARLAVTSLKGDDAVGRVVESLAVDRVAETLTSASRLVHAGPLVLMAGLGDVSHSLPLLAVESALEDDHTPTVNLGRMTPTSTVLQAITRLSPAVVYLWDEHRSPLDHDAWRLPAARPAPPVVVLGGPGLLGVGLLPPVALPSSVVDALDQIRAALPPD